MAAKAQAKTKKAPARARKSAAKTTGRKAPAARKTSARKTTARKTTARKTTARKPSPRKTTASKAPAARTPAKRTAARRAAKAPAAKRPARKPSPAARGSAKSATSRKSAPVTPFNLGKLGQVALTATDLSAAVAFYSNILGFKLIARFDEQGFAFFNLGSGLRLMVSATASAASLYFTVDNLDASVRQLRRRGVTFLQKPAMIHRDEDGDFGKKGVEEWMAFFHDPSGNLLALVERR